MSEPPRVRRRVCRFTLLAVSFVALALLGLAGWTGWKVLERARLRTEAHRGLEGVWVDDSGQDISYQFRADGEFLVRQKLPANLAPFSGDPGVDHRPWGKWSRNAEGISVQTVRHWGFALVQGEDGLLRGEYILDQWSGQGEHSQTRTPVVLRPQPRAGK